MLPDFQQCYSIRTFFDNVFGVGLYFNTHAYAVEIIYQG